MCTITHLGAISAKVAVALSVAISAYTSGDTRPMHGRYSVDVYDMCRPICLPIHVSADKISFSPTLDR